MRPFIIALVLLLRFLETDTTPVVLGLSSTVAHVDGGQVLWVHGAELPETGADCLFHFKPNRIMTEHRVKAVFLNSTTVTCTVPRSPYRLVLHHQHRLPWPGCSWDDRCMANDFSFSLEFSLSKASPPSSSLPQNTFNMSFYLGSFDPASPQQQSQIIAPNNTDQSDLLQSELYSLNHPRDCSNVQVLLLPAPTHQSQCTGIGMVFYAKYVTALKEAYEQGRALVFKDPFSTYCYFSDREHEAERYLLEPSNCTVKSINMSLAREFVPNAAWFSSVKRPPHFAGRSVAWFRSNFVRYLFRYTPSFEMHLANVKASIHFEQPCIGVHLRRGERGNVGFTTVWLAEYPLFDLSDAARLLFEYKRRSNVSTVFLATDEPSFFEDAKAYSSDFRILHDTFYPRAIQGRDCVRETIAGCTPGVNASSVVKTILTEVHLLSHCRYYAGTLTSTFSKLAVDFMMSRFPDTYQVVSLE